MSALAIVLALAAGAFAPYAVKAQVSATFVAGAPVTLRANSSGPNEREPRPLSIVLAQACWLEATWQSTDCAAIAYVILRRADDARMTPAAMAHAYSLDKKTPRAAKARALPEGLHARELERFAVLVDITEGVLEGRIANPCPRAFHWGSRVLSTDVACAEHAISQGRWRVVRCKKATANAFYAKAAAQGEFRPRSP